MTQHEERLGKHWDRIKLLHEEGKLVEIARILKDPEGQEILINLSSHDSLFIMDGDFIQAFKNVIQFSDEAKTRLIYADLQEVQASRMRRAAEEQLAVEKEEEEDSKEG